MGVWGRSPQEKDAAVRASCECCFVGCEVVARRMLAAAACCCTYVVYVVYDVLEFDLYLYLYHFRCVSGRTGALYRPEADRSNIIICLRVRNQNHHSDLFSRLKVKGRPIRTHTYREPCISP